MELEPKTDLSDTPEPFVQPATKWVLTIVDDDGIATHVETITDYETRRVLRMLEEYLPGISERAIIKELPWEWECDGSDNCMKGNESGTLGV